jgi:hypothetical protein
MQGVAGSNPASSTIVPHHRRALQLTFLPPFRYALVEVRASDMSNAIQCMYDMTTKAKRLPGVRVSAAH